MRHMAHLRDAGEAVGHQERPAAYGDLPDLASKGLGSPSGPVPEPPGGAGSVAGLPLRQTDAPRPGLLPSALRTANIAHTAK
jgi:hypothetical protein